MVSWPVQRRSPSWSVSGTLPTAAPEGTGDGIAVLVAVVVGESTETEPAEVSIGVPGLPTDRVPVAVSVGTPPGWVGLRLDPPP